MKRMLSTLFILTSLNAFALTEESKAVDLVKKYSSTIACSVNEDSFQSVRISSDYDEYSIVYWEGDVGCGGGSGTMSGVLTVVAIADGESCLFYQRLSCQKLNLYVLIASIVAMVS